MVADGSPTQYTIELIPVGRGEVPGPELFWMSRFDEWLPLEFQVALIRGDSITALVNTGPGRDLGHMNRQWEGFLGPRAAMQREDGEFILDQLSSRGVDPGEITHVILTPLQLYSVSNVLEFPNAEICISKKGWIHFHTTKNHPHDDRYSCLPKDVLVPLVTSEWERVRLLEDEDEIVPGIRTWWAGVHHRASVVVEVDTSIGTAAISDAYFWLENVTQSHPIGICENIYEALSTYERVRRDSDIVVPLYDPKNRERYGDGRIA